jgi:succinate dehydrogenase/fumarate reductase flavoprotein subunit
VFGADTSWDCDADVVVLGLGAAGAATALIAAKAGGHVVVLEKQAGGEDTAGTGRHLSSSHLSGGVYLQPTDLAGARSYFRSLSSFGTVPGGPVWCDETVRDAYCEAAIGISDWLASLGAEIRRFGSGAEHEFPGIETLDCYRFRGSGLGMMTFLETCVRLQPRIELRYSVAADKLLTDRAGRVVGVRGWDSRRRRALAVRARRGVVIATGGFEFNEELKLNNLRCYPVYFTGSPASTGDGVSLAADVGASLWHMNCVSARFVAKLDECASAVPLQINAPKSAEPWATIMVDQTGRRFTSERFKEHTVCYEAGLFDSQRLTFPRIPSYLIFDSGRMEALPLWQRESGVAGPALLRDWGHDNGEWLDRGYIVDGKDIADLAERIGIDGDRLSRTVREWNRACLRGKDGRFGRPTRDLVPLDRPPFYALQAWPGGSNTHGGARRDDHGRVLNVDRDPIPGLYAAGEFGSMFGMLYSGNGGTLSECFASGMIAGRALMSGGLRPAPRQVRRRSRNRDGARHPRFAIAASVSATSQYFILHIR